jgi:hypothetical protein
MSRNTICHACEDGDHKRHQRVVQAVSPGMLGGSVCVCQGECKDGRYKKTIDELLGLKPGDYERLIRARQPPNPDLPSEPSDTTPRGRSDA